MNVIDLAQRYGLTPKRVSTTKGGEYACACPWCGGNDRFRIWEEQNEGRGSYWCRGCSKHGDNIQFVMDTESIGFREAAEKVGEASRLNQSSGKSLTPSFGRHAFRLSGHAIGGSAQGVTNCHGFMPKEPDLVSDIWAEKAGKVVEWSNEKRDGSTAVDLLLARGFMAETISAMRLGWIPEDIYRTRESWGLPTIAKPDGTPKRLWIPAGVVIPAFDPSSGRVCRLRVRRNTGEPRYYLIPGSSMRQMILGDTARSVVVVESELDAMLIHQQAGDITCVLSLGNAQSKPDWPALEVLDRAAKILVALDFDNAGKLAFRWWEKTFSSRAVRHPVPIGKDPSDAYKEGLDLRQWIISGWPQGWRLTNSSEPRKSFKKHPAALSRIQTPKNVTTETTAIDSPKKHPFCESKNDGMEMEEITAAGSSGFDDHFESVDGIEQLYRLLVKNPKIKIYVDANRMNLSIPQDWSARHPSWRNRISSLVFFDPMVMQYLHVHGERVISSANFIKEV